MKEVKVLYVRNLLIDTQEEQLKNHFAQYGKIERVKKIRLDLKFYIRPHISCLRSISKTLDMK